MRSLTYKSKQGLTIKSITLPSQQPVVVDQFADKETKAEEEGIGTMDSREGKSDEANKTCSIFLLPFNKPHLKADRGYRITDILHKYKSSQAKKTSSKYPRTHFSHEPTNQSNLRDNCSQTKASKNKQRSLSQKIKPRRMGEPLEKIKMDNEANLMSSIEGLRKLEKGCLRIQKDEELSLRSIKLTRNSTPSSLAYEQSMRTKRLGSSQFANSPNLTQFREKIKLKLSRRHIYHTLRNKSEQLNKVRSKNPQPFHRIRASENFRGFPNQGSPLFSAHRHKHLSFNQLTVSPSIPTPDQSLKVDFRQAELWHSKYTQCSRGQPSQSILNTFLNYAQQKDTHGQHIQTMQRQATAIRQTKTRPSHNSPWTTSHIPKGRDNAATTAGINIFRELTPWHSEEVE